LITRAKPAGLVGGLLLICAAGLSAQENLLPNSSFEELDPKTACPLGWQPWVKENTAVYSLAAAHTGLACAAITDPSPTASQGLRSPQVAVAPGKVYEASVWVYVERVEAGSFSVYLEYWSGDTRVADFAVGTDVAGKWVQVRIAQPAPPGAKGATVLLYSSSATVGRALFDDASLRAM